MPPLRLIAVALLSSASCAANDPEQPAPDDSGTRSGFPFLAVTPSALDFGVLNAGASVDATVAIANIGLADLALDDVRLVPNDASVAVDWAGPTSIAPGDFVEVSLRWAPTTFANLAASLEIETNDVVRPLADVAVVGATLDPDIEVTPLEWDFGSVQLADTGLLVVTIANAGAADLGVSSLEYTANDTDLTLDDVTTPFVIAAGSTVDLGVSYRPSDFGADAGELTVVSDNPDEPAVKTQQSGSANVVYDAFDDFHLESNDDSDAWQYGCASSVGGDFTLYSTTWDSLVSGVISWTSGPNAPPAAAINLAGKEGEYQGTYFPAADFITMHPGNAADKRYSVLRFIVPADGDWTIDAGFKASTSPWPTSTDVHVVVAGVEDFAASISGTYDTDPTAGEWFFETVSLAEGDIVEFVVGPGPNHDYTSDTTGVLARVTKN